MKIALIPIDNRPVCYNLPMEIANIDKEIELLLPNKKLLGGLKTIANIESLLNWLEKIEQVDAIVVSLDTIVYGGLIPSRRSKELLKDIAPKLERIEKILRKFKKVYAFSSIMRISNNNVNEEEKEYWSEYGTQIFEYSYNFHKTGIDTTEVPQDILNDYLATRYRNFAINKKYLEWAETGIFEKIIFSKDDCSEHGLNVFESEILNKIIKEKNLPAIIKTGADEIPISLMARAICDYNKQAPKISAKFLAPAYKALISNYEDISIEKSTLEQIKLAGANIVSEDSSDILLLLNNFEEFQGEIVMDIRTKYFSGKLDLPQKPFMVADVRFSNGADNRFIAELFRKKPDFKYFYGYSGWNTSANTLGSLICSGIVRFFAKEYDEESFKKLQMVRLLDDWGYQANVRQTLKGRSNIDKRIRPDVRKLKKLMQPFERKVQKILGITPKIRYSFPWKRFFEVEIRIR